MGMIKILAPHSQNWDEAVAKLVKFSRRGLVGSDLDAFVKRAGAEFAQQVRQLRFEPGEVPIHLIALGATETYGPNRNGDGFRAQTCRNYHDTFVKHARWYRNHNNQDPSQSYGIVKLSTFNEPMQRIELIVALNGTKEAAERNGGLVAERELQKIAKDTDDWGVSMACRVPFDVCSGCGNRARSRAEYCTEDTCPYGGLKNNITKVAEDGHVLHADNPNPVFFDISDVYRPADRIAWVLGQVKAASGRVYSGAELAEKMGMFYPASQPGSTALFLPYRETLKKLAEIERRLESQPNLELDFRNGFLPFSKTSSGFWKKASQHPEFLSACNQRKIVLPLAEFLALGSSGVFPVQHVEKVAAHLPGIYQRLLRDPELDSKLSASPYPELLQKNSLAAQRLAGLLVEDFSLEKAASLRRKQRSCLHSEVWRKPVLQWNDAASACSQEYALYKLAAVHQWRNDPEFLDLCAWAVRQNYLLPA